MCARCKPTLNKHTPDRCCRKCPFSKHQNSSSSYNSNNSNRTKISNCTEPNLQLSVSTNRPDHIAELLQAEGKMTIYLKRLFKHNKPQSIDNNNPIASTNHHKNPNSGNISTNHEITVMKSMKLLTQHTYLTPHFQNLKITNSTMTQTALIA